MKNLVRLLTLVATFGAASVGVYVLNPGVTRQDLLDAGAADVCNAIVVSCEGRRSDGTYARAKTRALLCRDDAGTGVVLPRATARGLDVFNPTSCRRVGTGCTDPSVCQADDGGAAPEVDDTPDCACSTGSGCLVPDGDGGTVAASMGQTLAPGQFSGAGCAAKTCGVYSGSDTSFPAACLPDGGG